MKIDRIETFQVAWSAERKSGPISGWIRVVADDGQMGIGEVSPMIGGYASLAITAAHIAPTLVGADPLDHAVIQDRLMHRLVKLGPEGAVTAALAGLDIALWDLKGKLLGQPIYKLLGGAWRTRLPLYSSVGNNGYRTVDEVLRVVEARIAGENPSLVKIRFDRDRTTQDEDIPDDIAKAKAVRALVGDDFRLAFDANNNYSIGGAIRMGHALEELGFEWFEEPVQHYYPEAMGRVARELAITVSAGEQTYTLQALRQLIDAGVTMVQPDITKMGGITGLMRCIDVAYAAGVEIVPHQTQPIIGNAAVLHVLATQMHMTKPVEFNEPSGRQNVVFVDPPSFEGGFFDLPSGPGLGLTVNETELQKRRIDIVAPH